MSNVNEETSVKSDVDIDKGVSVITDKVFDPVGILNYSIDEEGAVTKAVVLDKDGTPKQIENVTAIKDTSIQIFDPDSGDILIELKEGNDDINVITGNRDDEPVTNLESLVSSEFFEVTEAFLDVNSADRYFFIKDHSAHVNGIDINEVFKRRHHMASILKGVHDSIADQLSNWIDRSPSIDVMSLNWENSKSLIDTDVILSVYYDYGEQYTFYNSTQVIIWRMISGEEVGELMQLPVDPASLLAGSKYGSVQVDHALVLDEHVFKVMVITQRNDEPVEVELLHKDGYLEDSIPTYVHTSDPEHLMAMAYFDLEEADDKTVIMNTLDFKHTRQFSVDQIARHKNLTYLYSRFVSDDSEVVEVDLTDKADVVSLTSDIFKSPMVHCFEQLEDDVLAYCFVNLPESTYERDEEELIDGTFTE